MKTYLFDTIVATDIEGLGIKPNLTLLVKGASIWEYQKAIRFWTLYYKNSRIEGEMLNYKIEDSY